MGSEQILGTWKSTEYKDRKGRFRKYERQELTFNPDGTGNLFSKTIIKRNIPFTWEFDGPDFRVYGLAGKDSVAVAAIKDDELGIVESGILVVYEKA